MAGNVSGWVEGIVLSIAFVVVLVIVTANMNVMYGKNYVLPISDNSTQQLFVQYQDTAQNQIKSGDVLFGGLYGITLKSSYGITTDAMSIVWSFLSGGWIEKTAQMWNVGESGMALAHALRIIYFLSLVFALLYALFKVAL